MKRTKSTPAADYFDPTLSVEQRVADLLGRMTLRDKLRQMTMETLCSHVKNGRVPAGVIERLFGKRSIGCVEDPRLKPEENARTINALQKYLTQKTRLGIPALVTAECLHGHLSPGTTVFPQAIGLGSTWDPTLIGKMAQAIAKEARAVGISQALSPDLDLARDPRWGRVEETYGEDPYLVGAMGLAYVKAMQGRGKTIDREHLVCTLKHYAAHGSPESGVNLGPVAGGMHDLRTVYLPPFERAVKEGGALSVMPAYSEYEGVPLSKSTLLLQEILRDEWGFDGYLFADYGAIEMLNVFHHTAADDAEAARQTLEAGMDLGTPGTYDFGGHLLDQVRRGEISEDLIDQAAGRILRVKFLAGLFENPYVEVKRVEKIVNCAKHRTLARRLAQESIVLLKNNKAMLPLKRDLSWIAVIGPNADTAQFGDYTMPGCAGVSPLEGIRAAVAKRTGVGFQPGCSLYGQDREGIAAAVELAENSDVAIVVVGGTSHYYGGVGWGGDSGAATCGEGFDSHDLQLPGVQAELVQAVAQTGTPTVLVLVHGRPHNITEMVDSVAAVIDAWYPGQEGGSALADILFGKVNPSGKLPISIPRSVGHVPCYYNRKPSARGYYHQPGRPGQPGRDYVFDHPGPLFPFGHGLSYTTFKYTALKVTPRTIDPIGQVTVSVKVTNTGKMAGKEVVQLYLNDVVSSVTTPVQTLRGFKKVPLRPGESKVVEFTLTPDDLKLWDPAAGWAVEPGDFEVSIGTLKKTFTVKSK